ncbi:MAG TPA: uracil-DNA glycosylase [Gemmatimonadaceae bacterium]
MHAEDLLRRYLEQRRDQGEVELVLDTLSVEDAMQIIGAARRGRADAAPTPPAPGDWRHALRSAGAEVSTATPARRPLEPAPLEAPTAPAALPPDGLVVGTEGNELFGGELAHCQTIDDVAALIKDCRKCELYRTAKHPVPGEGSAAARLVCVGEAPGASEDETGRPFVGQAGMLLTKILEAINLSRDEAFIVNVLKHRPPGNRNPLPAEVEACRPYLVRQLEIIRPSVIVAFGTFAAQTLLDTKLSISKLRGAIHRYHGIPVVVTYHPAALLRNPAWKRPTWEDVQLARRLLDGVRK